jgi:hypothetical protein
MKIYYYGSIKFKYKDVKKNNDYIENNDYTVLTNQKDYNFDYIITRKYNSDYYKGLSNKERFELLIKIIKMLEKFRKYNRFLADLKWGNIGLDENNNPILIDYDNYSIIEIIPENFIMKDGLVIKKKFTFTFTPEYLKDSGNDIKKFDKFSIRGLQNIIEILHAEFKQSTIILPKDKQYKNQSQIKSKSRITFEDLFYY